MNSLCDATKRSVWGALKAIDRADPYATYSFETLDEIWKHHEQVERKKAKENQKENIKLMEEGYRRQPELITGEKIDCLVQCPNCGKKIGEVIDGTINPEIVKKMFVRDDK